MKIAIANASTLVDDVDAAVMAEAEKHSLDIFAMDWDREPPEVAFTTDPANAGLGLRDCLIVILDDADQAGALGYHAVTPTGQAYARVFARDSIAGLTGTAPGSVSGVQASDVVLACVAPVVDHEAKEALADPEAGGWEDDGTGTTAWAREVCDPVESDLDPTPIALSDGTTRDVTLSNHVLPAFFDPSDETGPWDHSGNLTGPFTLDAGGYAILEQEGQVSLVFGDKIDGWRRQQHVAAKVAAEAAVAGDEMTAHLASRTAKQICRHHGLEFTVGSEADAAESHPEPVPAHGAGTAQILQDNVSEPGTEITRTLVGGEVVESRHQTTGEGAEATEEAGDVEDTSDAPGDAAEAETTVE